MKKLILGAVLFMTGMLSGAILLAGSMAQYFTTTTDGQTYVYSALRILNDYGLLRVMVVLLIVALVGLAMAVLGLKDKN